MKKREKQIGIWVPGNDAVHVELLCGQGVSTAVVSCKQPQGIMLYPTGLAIPSYKWSYKRERPKGRSAETIAALKTILEVVKWLKAQLKGPNRKERDISYTYQMVLATDHKENGGYCPVCIRRLSDSQVSVMDTGVQIREADWDTSEGLPSLNAHNGAFLRQELLRILRDTQEADVWPWVEPGICVFPYSGHQTEDGRLPVYVLFTADYKQALIRSTGVYLLPEEWNFQTGLPQRSCRLYEVWRKRIEDVYSQCVEERKGVVARAVDNVVMPVTDDGIPMWVGPYVHFLLDEMRRDKIYGNRSVYTTALNTMLATCGSLNIPFSSLSLDVLRKIELRMRDNGLKDTTISTQFRTIRAIYNRAIKDGVAAKSDYPFDQFQMSRFDLSTAHRALSKEEIRRIIIYQVQPCDLAGTELARDMFVFSYLCGGVSFYDLCKLQMSNITDGVLTYCRQKTHLPIRVAVPEEAAMIITKYGPQSKGYLFPILNEDTHTTELQIRNRVMVTLSYINNALRQLGEKLGLPLKLTTYVARHSFASVLKEEGVPTTTISDMMGHQKLNTTKIYLKGFSVNQMAKVQELLYDTNETAL